MSGELKNLIDYLVPTIESFFSGEMEHPTDDVVPIDLDAKLVNAFVNRYALFICFNMVVISINNIDMLFLRRGFIYTFFYKKPLYQQPSTRECRIEETFRTTKKELRNLRHIAHRYHYLVQRKAAPKQCEYDIAFEFNSY